VQRKKEKNNNSAGASYYYEDAEDDGGTTTEEDNDTSEKVILEISVTDTGIGIPADRLPMLFKSFSQIDISTARRYGGTGLGLAISSMLVNRMGGGLWVESEEGLGSRFALTLPLSVASKRPSSIATSSFGQASESSGTYTSSGMIASPPSPGSSVSDGGSSVGEQRNIIEANGNIINTIASSPSSSTSYFTGNNSRKHNSTATSFPWENTTIPSTPSPSSISSNDQGNNICINANTDSLSPNNSNSISNNISKGLQNMLSKSHDLSIESSKNNLNNTTTITNTTKTMTTSNNNNNNNNNNTTITPTTIAAAAAAASAADTIVQPQSQLQQQQQPKQQPKQQLQDTKSKPSRMTISKHHRKSHSISHEENLALLYPIKIMLAEDNVCKYSKYLCNQLNRETNSTI
jgi:chemotaxis protein histidine kinase CheA